MADTFNVLPVPSYTQVDEVTPDEILASTRSLLQKGVTVASDQGILPAGTCLGRVTSTKKYVVYDNTADDGSEVARGFLRQKVDTSDGDVLANIVLMGVLVNSKLSGVDANAVTDLNARQDTVRDLFIF